MAQAARLSLRMQKELKLLSTEPPPGVSLVVSEDGSSMPSLFNIEARIVGPEETAYAGGIFTVRIQIPERYPFQPPNVTFVTPVYHPNIDNGGRICLDILNLPPKGAWQPSLNISTVLTSIALLLGEPNPDDGLMCEASREYKYNRQVFDQKARSWTEKYAKSKFDGNKMDASTGDPSGDTSSMMESEPSWRIAGDSASETDANRKKKRVAGNRLSLRPIAVADKGYHSNKENMTQTGQLGNTSLSSSQKTEEGPPAFQEVLKHESISDEYLVRNHALQISSKENEVSFGSKPIEIAIVSDSEESEDENERQKRTRLSLFRKRIAGGGRSSWSR